MKGRMRQEILRRVLVASVATGEGTSMEIRNQRHIDLRGQSELFLLAAGPRRCQEDGAKKRHHRSPSHVNVEGGLDNASLGRAQEAISTKDRAQEQKQKSDGKSYVEIQ